jgi:uncharacterized oxidoreductase
LEIGGNTVLITGGATGIGFALAEKFVGAGSDAIVCGRRKSNLQDAYFPDSTRCDVTWLLSQKERGYSLG